MSQWSFLTVHVHMTSPTTQRGTFNALALLFLPILCLVGLIGNALVCIAIWADRRLHNVTNYFLFSLAVADLLVCCIVMPLSILVEVRHGVWTWSVSLCLLYVYSDVFLCSASIVHMSVISLDRYLGISQPLRTRNKSKTLILIKIIAVWLITLLVSCPIAVIAIYDNENILQNNSCAIFSRYYIIYGSTMTFLIPFCIMAITYVRTTALLKKQASILSQKANDKLNGNGLRRTMPHRKLGYVRTNSTSTGITNGGTSGGGQKSSSTSNGAFNSGHKPSVVSYSNGFRTSSVGEVDADKLLLRSTSPTVSLLNNHKKLDKKTSKSTLNKWKNRTSNYLTNIAMRVSRRNSIQSASQELANEHKATRVLAVVFVCFFICWTPFFVANFIQGFCGNSCDIPPWMGSIFLWLGYISSTINPLIYTTFNKRFRQAFVRILRCQCFHPIRDPHALYSRNYTTTMIPDTYTCMLSLSCAITHMAPMVDKQGGVAIAAPKRSNHDREKGVSIHYKDESADTTTSSFRRQGSEKLTKSESKKFSLQTHSHSPCKPPPLPLPPPRKERIPTANSSRDSSFRGQWDNSRASSFRGQDDSRASSFRGPADSSRATTEEMSDDDRANEQRPLIPPKLGSHSAPQPYTHSGTLNLRRSITTVIQTSPCGVSGVNSHPKASASCADCHKAEILLDSDEEEEETSTTMTSSMNSSQHKHHHVTLFTSQFGRSIKETFL